MKATAVEFRFRFAILIAVFVLGFVAPWDYALSRYGMMPDSGGVNAHLWGVLSAAVAKTGVMGIAAAFDVLLVVGIVLATAGAWWRTWAAAYLAPEVVRSGEMHAAMVADGPYRHVRNPLYLGAMLHGLALMLLMPVSGAVFVLVLVPVFFLRLILREEWFLRTELGEAYVAYCAAVPRLVPALRAKVPGAGRRARWGKAVLSELFGWGVAGSFAVAGWWYNAALLVRCVLVSLGVGLVARGVMPRGSGKW